jgi:hypothetical protein
MFRRTGLVVFLLAILAALTPTATASAAPYCGITWGSATKSATPTTIGTLTNIRTGQDTCWDRMVFDVTGNANGYWVSYVDTMYEDPTGNVIPLRGGAKLSVTVQAPTYDLNGNPTYHYTNRNELANVTGYQTFRQVAFAGSWEGTTTVGLGVRARLPFRVFTLPGKIVVDVAHQW